MPFGDTALVRDPPSVRRFALLLLLLAGCEPDLLQEVTPVLELEGGAIEFGVVPEGETAVGSVTLSNPVGVAVDDVVLELDPSSSADFEVLTSTRTLGPGAQLEVEVRFTPIGAGEDEGTLWVRSAALADGPAQVTLHGGPIDPAIVVSPDPIDFGPATTATVTRTFEISNEGTAILTVDGLRIDEDGNTDFVLRAWELPVAIAPGERVPGAIDYVRSGRATAGRLLVESDDPDAAMLEVRLLPDPYRACEDGEDNDDDGLVDFPDDPGCASLTDDDESNPPECEDGLTEVCGTDVGECEFGRRVCANRIWGPCEGETGPADELCDDLDNDCDGTRDESITETCTVNDCGGVRACVEDSGVAGGAWTECIPVGGQSETCDGIDNDCNGIIDDGIVEACAVNMCMGTRICVPGGMGEYTNCQVTTTPEMCNGVDDDCDGVPDDGLPVLTCGMGVCTATAASCVGGMPGTCTPGPAGAETCNNLDDDCNGMPDDLPNLTCGTGECARSVPACVNGTNNQCVAGTPTTETCNGLDDDCNGTPDDGIPNLTCGVGACARSVAACNGPTPNTCVPGLPGTEICNNLDDDCNGTPDDGIPDLTCGVGECARTAPACLNGGNNTCVPGAPVPEICNGLDDDCNGVPDNGVCGTPSCGLSITTADPQEPNNSAAGANPVNPPVLGTQTYTYDVTLTPGDTDWIAFNFPPPGAASIATMTAQVTCVDWATATGCPATPTVGLAAWYFDDVCSPGGQQDGFNDGTGGLATVTSMGSVSPFGICTPQRFRLSVFPSATVCAGEALNAEVTVTVTYQ